MEWAHWRRCWLEQKSADPAQRYQLIAGRKIDSTRIPPFDQLSIAEKINKLVCLALPWRPALKIDFQFRKKGIWGEIILSLSI